MLNKNTSTEKIEPFDKVIVCTGFFSTPNYASFEKFLKNPSVKLKISHVSYYRNPEDYRGKRIMVIGHGHSATQIASEVSKTASSTFNVFRNPRWILQKLVDSQQYKKKLSWDIPLLSTREIRENFSKLSKNERNKLRNNVFNQVSEQNSLEECFHLDKDAENPPMFGISNFYFSDVKKGLIKPLKTEVKNIIGKTVELMNGDFYEIDEVILCTGYNVDFSFLDPQILKSLNYDPKNTRIPLQLEGNFVYNSSVKNLAFVGFMSYDLVFSAYEFQAKVAVNYLKNSDFGKKKTREEYDYKDPAGYVDFLAEEVGCLPDLQTIEKEDKELFDFVVKGPFLVNHYELRKENYGTKRWKKNAEFIKKFNNDLARNYLM